MNNTLTITMKLLYIIYSEDSQNYILNNAF